MPNASFSPLYENHKFVVDILRMSMHICFINMYGLKSLLDTCEMAASLLKISIKYYLFKVQVLEV